MGRRTRRAERATMEEIEAMPALITTDQLAHITGYTRQNISKMCKHGMFKDCSVMVGKAWSISKAKALEILGLA